MDHSEASPRIKRIQNDLMTIAQHRLSVSKRKYPQDPNLQYMDTVGYLIGIISALAEKDSLVEGDLYRHLNKLSN